MFLRIDPSKIPCGTYPEKMLHDVPYIFPLLMKFSLKVVCVVFAFELMMIISDIVCRKSRQMT